MHTPWMSRTLVTLLGCGVILCANGLVSASEASPRVVDRPLAVVNDAPIFASELRARAGPFLSRLRKEMSPGPARKKAERKLVGELLEKLIDERLMRRVAKRDGVTVASSQVDDALRHIADAQKISMDELLRSARAAGLSEAAYRREIHQQLLEAKLLQNRIRHRRLAAGGKLSTQQIEKEKKAWMHELRREAYVEQRF